MQKDTIVEEVRKTRHEIERECQENPDKLLEYFRASQGKLGIVSCAESQSYLSRRRRRGRKAQQGAAVDRPRASAICESCFAIWGLTVVKG